HEAADHTDLVLRQIERGSDLVPNAPEPLRRGVDVDGLAFPLADRLMRLECVVQDALRAVLSLDHDIGLGEATLDVAALVELWVAQERLSRERLVDVEQRLEHLPLDRDLFERRS